MREQLKIVSALACLAAFSVLFLDALQVEWADALLSALVIG